MNITLRQMSYFKTLSEQRNFRRAAEVSNISQPALSIQIKEMEERLGAQLVERQARDIVLTPFGRLILDHCLQVLKAAQALDDAAKWHGARRGRLSIGVIPTIAPYLLPDVLAQLRARDLELDLQVQESKTETLEHLLRSGDLDAAIMALPSGGTDFIDEPLFEDRFLLAGTQTRLSQYADPLIASELQSGQLMLLEEGNCLTDQALQVCGRTRSHPQINMGASSMATLTRLVATGFGVTLMPELAARAEQFSVEGLSLRRFSDVEPSRHIGLVRRASTPREAWVVSLIDILRDVGQGIVARCRADV
jgi:LysR family hydrogen peroxide-inducible transcriptional activator